jgi:dienelactone hydrolase
MPLPGFSESTFTHEGTTRTVFRKGTGPGVVIMPEIPGITPAVAGFAERVAGEGFTAFVVSLFGVPGKAMTPLYTMSSMARTCVSKEFSVLAARGASPITHYMRAFSRKVYDELGGKGVGAIGMCMTGNFALALMVDEWVMAPVLSQPSLPLGVGAERRAGLHVSDEDLVRIKQRVAGGCKVLGMRFTHDPLVPGERFERLRRELGDGFEGIEIDSSPGNPYGIRRRAHSVVTTDLVDREGHPTQAALARVLAFFRERLT